MYLSDIINKSSPVYKQKEMSKSEYKKLVDRNTELIDKIKDLQEIINKAIEDIDFCLKSINQEYKMSTDERTKIEMKSCKHILEELLNILKGEDKE